MNRPARILICIPLVMALGCHSNRIKETAPEPNIPQESGCISTESNVCDTDTNAPADPNHFTLSGSLGIGHATLRGLPGDPNSLANGTYSVTVEPGWSGTVTPEKKGFSFSPPSRHYEPFVRNVRHEIYIPRAVSTKCPNEPEPPRSRSKALTGTLKLDGVPIQGITLRTLASAATARTDPNGFFSMEVPADWTGTLRLQAPDPAEDAASEEKPVLVCRLEVVTTDTPQAAKAVSTTPEAKGTAVKHEPLTIVGTSCLPVEAVDELDHDLQVMCRLLSEEAFGLSLVRRDPNSEPKAVYLAEDGALFDVCIDWPLAGQLPEPNVPERSAGWKTAREWVERQSQCHGALEALHHMKTQAFIHKMTRCLVHAANIRHLPDDQHITLHIWGPPPSKNLVIRARLKHINDYAEAILAEEAFEAQVELKLH